MKSTGKTKINFVYSADAVLAILLLLTTGECGETYNVASDALNYNMLDMARYIANKNGVEVRQNIDNEKNKGIAADDAMILDTDKITSLGWMPKYNIEEALTRYMEYLRGVLS